MYSMRWFRRAGMALFVSMVAGLSSTAHAVDNWTFSQSFAQGSISGSFSAIDADNSGVINRSEVTNFSWTVTGFGAVASESYDETSSSIFEATIFVNPADMGRSFMELKAPSFNGGGALLWQANNNLGILFADNLYRGLVRQNTQDNTAISAQDVTSNSAIFTQISAVPEMESSAMFLAGLAAMGSLLKRRRRGEQV